MTETLIVLSVAIAPGLFWLWFFYSRDKLEKEPLGQVVAVYLFGMLAIIPALIIELSFTTSTMIDTVIIAPLAEEPSKLLCLLILLKRKNGKLRRNFNEPMDGIVYGAAAALGFATVENVFYIVNAAANDGMGAISILRAIFSVPGHALWGAFWGFAVSKAWFTVGSQGKKFAIILGGLIVAMLFHGLFNFGAGMSDLAGIGIILVLSVFFWILIMRRIKRAEAASPFSRSAAVPPDSASAQVPPGAQWPDKAGGQPDKIANDDKNSGMGI
ncbi:MAG: PrsW family intramembrane metalloprotease [Brevinematales bacterium]|nr:PrsW family intramembrane metalloprotease [Brevinematales bacterium]